MSEPKNIILLGATGSVGANVLKVVAQHPQKLRLVAVVAHGNAKALLNIAETFSVPHMALYQESAREAIADCVPSSVHLHPSGKKGLAELLELKPHLIVAGASGIDTAETILLALKSGIDVALANKELLSLAGPLFTQASRDSGACILPVDSEHNALFQCLEGHCREDVSQLILTASGGPFLRQGLEELEHITPQEALKHPKWEMGAKITIDSSTMANKALELIEAHWLFEQIPTEVVIHPQSIIHSLVQYRDGSTLAQLSPPSMIFPIQHTLFYPERPASLAPTLDWKTSLHLDLEPLDPERFGFIPLAQEVLRSPRGASTIFNAANEQAVRAFLQGKLGYLQILPIVKRTLEAVADASYTSLQEAIHLHQISQRTANNLIESA